LGIQPTAPGFSSNIPLISGKILEHHGLSFDVTLGHGRQRAGYRASTGEQLQSIALKWRVANGLGSQARSKSKNGLLHYPSQPLQLEDVA
jgi:hypothetical protein